MSVSGPQKVKILESDLPSVTLFSDLSYGYTARYRVISEDQNRYSHYSPTYRVKPNYVFERLNNKTLADVLVISQGPYVNIVWEPILIKDKVSGTLIRRAIEYDLWLRWDKADGGTWEFQERVQGTAQGFVIPETYTLANGTVVDQKPNHVSVEIYLRSTNPQRTQPSVLAHPLLVFKLDNETI
jgi:hypothetical protein